MPVYQSKKAGLGRQEVRVTVPDGAAVFAVDCVLPHQSDKNDTVWVYVPDGFCLVNAVTGTGLVPHLTGGVWKTKREKIERAELFCVANSLTARGMQGSYAIRIPYERETESGPVRAGLEYVFSMEVGEPTALCQLCRGLDAIPLRCDEGNKTTSVESVMLDAIRGSSQALFASADESCDGCQRAAEAFKQIMDNVGLAVKDCTVTPWATLDK